MDTHIKGTLNVCQAAKELGGIRVLVTSTSEVYGTAQYVPIDEKHPKQAQSPYSATKIGADAIAMSFYNAFNLPVTIVRPFNTYGPRQSARAIIPTIITQIAGGMKEINIASNYEISMGDTLNLIKSIMKSDVRFITDQVRLRPENSEVFRLWGDNRLISSLTDWHPEYTIETGLKETVDWFYKPENQRNYKAGIYNL